MQKIILNRYEVIKKLGEGATGAVFLVKDLAEKQSRAIKVMPIESTRQQRRFQREIQALGAVRHKNLVNIHDSYLQNNKCYIVMDYIDGSTLKEYLEKNELTPETTINIVLQIARGLKSLHTKGIIHRDIKPDNILIDNQQQVYVADFGLVKLVNKEESVQLTQTGSVIGTPAYLSPEQAQGEHKKTDERTDIYSLGAILYEMLCGRQIFEGETTFDILVKIVSADMIAPSELKANVPEDLEAICLLATQRDYTLRYRSLDEMLRDLALIQDGYEPTASSRLNRQNFLLNKAWLSRGNVLVGLLILLLLLLPIFFLLYSKKQLNNLDQELKNYIQTLQSKETEITTQEDELQSARQNFYSNHPTFSQRHSSLEKLNNLKPSSSVEYEYKISALLYHLGQKSDPLEYKELQEEIYKLAAEAHERYPKQEALLECFLKGIYAANYFEVFLLCLTNAKFSDEHHPKYQNLCRGLKKFPRIFTIASHDSKKLKSAIRPVKKYLFRSMEISQLDFAPSALSYILMRELYMLRELGFPRGKEGLRIVVPIFREILSDLNKILLYLNHHFDYSKLQDFYLQDYSTLEMIEFYRILEDHIQIFSSKQLVFIKRILPSQAKSVDEIIRLKGHIRKTIFDISENIKESISQERMMAVDHFISGYFYIESANSENQESLAHVRHYKYYNHKLSDLLFKNYKPETLRVAKSNFWRCSGYFYHFQELPQEQRGNLYRADFLAYKKALTTATRAVKTEYERVTREYDGSQKFDIYFREYYGDLNDRFTEVQMAYTRRVNLYLEKTGHSEIELISDKAHEELRDLHERFFRMRDNK